MAVISDELAEIVRATSHDYPLVQFPEEKGGPQLLWVYAHLIIAIFAEPGLPPAIRLRSKEWIEVEVSSLQEGMRLMRYVEAILQDRQRPSIELA